VFPMTRSAARVAKVFDFMALTLTRGSVCLNGGALAAASHASHSPCR
jgi:hypothetical protein